MWGLSIGVRPLGAGPEVPGEDGEVGWSGLANTFFMVNPKRDLVAVVMAQYLGPNGNDLSAVFRTGVYEALKD
jgi:CubicO group peptidase (beta-lactamase class C family)